MPEVEKEARESMRQIRRALREGEAVPALPSLSELLVSSIRTRGDGDTTVCAAPTMNESTKRMPTLPS